jgi:ribosomal protein S18 acetylase RimI-like enzyme
MPVTIRPVAPGDKAAWSGLFVAYGEFYRTSFSPEVVDEVWQWLLDTQHPVSCMVAEVEGAVVGFAHLRRQDNTFTASPNWFLDDLFVAPDHRGHGIARALIREVSRFAAEHGGGQIRWITASDNHAAQALYDSLATRTDWVMYEKPSEDNS